MNTVLKTFCKIFQVSNSKNRRRLRRIFVFQRIKIPYKYSAFRYFAILQNESKCCKVGQNFLPQIGLCSRPTNFRRNSKNTKHGRFNFLC